MPYVNATKLAGIYARLLNVLEKESFINEAANDFIGFVREGKPIVLAVTENENSIDRLIKFVEIVNRMDDDVFFSKTHEHEITKCLNELYDYLQVV